MPTPQPKIDLSAGLQPSQRPIDLSAGLGGTPSPAPLPQGVTKDAQGRYGSVAPPSTASLYWKALFNPVGSGAHPQGLVGGAEQVGGQAMQTMLSPVMHPIDTAKGIWATAKEAAQDVPQSPFYNPAAEAENPGPFMQQGRELKNEWKNNKPLALENAAGNVLGMVEGGRMVSDVVPRALDAVPRRARAVATLNDIEKQAAQIPVYPESTRPALAGFERHVDTGGQDAPVMSLLRNRIAGVAPRPEPEPIPIHRADRLLEGGTEDIPLRTTRTIRPKGSPMAFNAEALSPDVWRVDQEGMPVPGEYGYGEPLPGPQYLSGSEHSELSGHIGKVQGVLRRPRIFDQIPAPLPKEYAPPLNFPEARSFYTNVSDVTKPPGMLKRMLEDSSEPRMRMKAGNVREALHSDLTNAASSIGRGEDYANAIKEYAQNAQLRNYLKRAGIAVAPIAAGSAGLGTAHRLISRIMK